MLDYPVRLTPDGGSVIVTSPDVLEAVTFGADEAEALFMAVDALESALSFYVDDSRPLPEPSIQPGLQSVSPSALECIKPGFYREMMAQGKFEKPLSPKNK